MNDFDNLFSSAAKPAAGNRHDLGGSARFGDAGASIDLDSMYSSAGAKHSSLPVFDKPLYDDDDGADVDIFDGVPGLKSSASARFDNDVFSISRDKKKNGEGGFDELLGGLRKKESDFDDLIPGFGGSSPPLERRKSEAARQAEPAASVPKASPNAMEDPFSVFESVTHAASSSSGLFTDPSEEISKRGNSRSTRFDDISNPSKRVQNDMDPFDDLGKSVPTFSSETNNRGKGRGPSKTDSGRSGSQAYAEKEQIEKQYGGSRDSFSNKSMYVDNDLESHQTLFGMPPISTGSHKPIGQMFSSPSAGATSNGSNVRANTTPVSEEKVFTDDVWLTVSEIPLYTQPTSVPPPSRPPPPIPLKRKVNTSSSKSSTSFQSPKTATWSSVASVDELEEFARGSNISAGDKYANGSADDGEMNSVAAASAAAMKDAMDRAEAKFRHAREARERESTWAFRSKEYVQVERDENHERLDREQLQREREEEEEEREQRRQDNEREEREYEHRRLAKERARAREIERERARQAVERATREARERATIEVRLKAERAAVDKAATEARERAERAAVQRAQAEARARAAAGAKERAEKAAAEARERDRAAGVTKERDRAAAEAREKAEARVRAERAAAERAAAEARTRAAAGAQERAAAAAKANQQRNNDDLESFFSMGRASSAPRPRPNSSDPFDTQFQSKQGSEPTKSSATSSTNIRKASSSTNIVDDLSSIFGAAPSSGEFQDIQGESEERRRARLERHQRTQERTAKALAEKNQRDLQVQRDQAERHRISETLDIEIKRWAAGKDGNLRALLSTLQYVLWPECGWQPVSLTDLITAAAVKKSYRKATLCVHPDKVQQKGANLQQKYIAEKVFDLLKEAWNKFNSEELF